MRVSGSPSTVLFFLVEWDRTKVNTCDVVVVSVYFADDKKKAVANDPFDGEPINNEDTPF